MIDKTEKEGSLSQDHPDKYFQLWMLTFLPRNQGQRDLAMALTSLVLGFILGVITMKLLNTTAGIWVNAIVVGYFGEYYLSRMIGRRRK